MLFLFKFRIILWSKITHFQSFYLFRKKPARLQQRAKKYFHEISWYFDTERWKKTLLSDNHVLIFCDPFPNEFTSTM